VLEETEEGDMRYVYIGLVVIVTAIVLLFKIENLAVVTVSLFGMGMTMPVFLLVVGIYILGMLTGSSLLALLRVLVRGATQK
jgi:lipopolysaccharide assembly protein A